MFYVFFKKLLGLLERWPLPIDYCLHPRTNEEAPERDVVCLRILTYSLHLETPTFNYDTNVLG